MNEDV